MLYVCLCSFPVDYSRLPLINEMTVAKFPIEKHPIKTAINPHLFAGEVACILMHTSEI